MNIGVEILKILLKDNTTGKNILWATSDYKNIVADEKIQLEFAAAFVGFCEIKILTTRKICCASSRLKKILLSMIRADR